MGALLEQLGYKGATRELVDRVSAAEGDFVLAASEKGHGPILRDGWPDFLVQHRDGHWIGVEVKRAPSERLRSSQARCFTVLALIGLRVFVWTPAEPGRLVPWAQHHEATRARRPRARKL